MPPKAKIGGSFSLDSGLSTQPDERDHRYQVNDQKRGGEQKIQWRRTDIIDQHHRQKEEERKHSDKHRPLQLGRCYGRRVGAFITYRHYASAVVGSMIVLTSETLLAGKPPREACSRTISSLGAI